jgi:hypothetical protein
MKPVEMVMNKFLVLTSHGGMEYITEGLMSSMTV